MGDLIIGVIVRSAGLLVFLAALSLTGRAVRESLGAEIEERTERLLWDLVLGTTAVAVLITLGGFLGLYRLSFFVPVLALGPLLRIRGVKSLGLRRDPSFTPARPHGSTEWVAAAGAGACALAVFAGALVPETFYDALYYHLGLPSQYLLQNTIATRPAVVHSAFPAYHDSLLGALLALGGAPLARLFTFATYLFGGLSCSLLARLLLGTGGGPAALFLMSIPGIVIMSSMTNVDTGMLWYSAMALAGAARASGSRGAERRRWSILSAIPLGMAVGSKYTGLFLLPIPALVLLASGEESPLKRLRSVSWLAGTALLVASPWYLRNLAVYGNPVFPALDSLFGPTQAGQWALGNLKKDISRLPLSFREMGNLPVLLSSSRLHLGAGAEIGWGVLVLLPSALAAAISKKAFRPYLAGAAVFVLLWGANHAAVRYLYPILPLFAAAGGWAMAVSGERRHLLRLLISLALAVMVVFNLLAAGRVLVGQFGGRRILTGYLTGKISAGTYLTAMLPYYEMALWMNVNLPPGAQVLFLGETRVLYVERVVRFSSAYDHTDIVRWMRESPGDDAFRERIAGTGADHLLINASEVGRLNKTYRYMDLSPRETDVLNHLLKKSTLLRSRGDIHLFRLPGPGDSPPRSPP
jgi:hypothetical protein